MSAQSAQPAICTVRVLTYPFSSLMYWHTNLRAQGTNKKRRALDNLLHSHSKKKLILKLKNATVNRELRNT